MPKATWGAGITADDIEKAESGGRQPYDGPLPKRGVFRFKLVQLKQDESKEGNPKLRSGWELDGSWKENHKEFNGAPLWDHMPVMSSTAWRVKALCLALGVTASDFYAKTVVDEDGVVTKIGNKLIKDKDVFVYISVKLEEGQDGREDQLRLNGSGYLPKKDDEEGTAPASDEDDAEEKPKKGKEKGGKDKPTKESKKGKKAKDDDTEPPF